MAWRRDPLRDDADLRLAGSDQARAVGADQARVRVTAEEILDPDHVLDRDALGDAYDQRDPRRGGFHDRVGREWRWDEDAGGVGACRFDGVGDGVEHRNAEMLGPAFAGTRAADDVGAEGLHLLGVKSTLAAGDALDDHLRGAIEEDAHLTPAFVNSTIFFAASHPLTPGSIPFFFRISRPSSSLVPLMRTTS